MEKPAAEVHHPPEEGGKDMDRDPDAQQGGQQADAGEEQPAPYPQAAAARG